jgi:hypothetical protein
MVARCPRRGCCVQVPRESPFPSSPSVPTRISTAREVSRRVGAPPSFQACRERTGFCELDSESGGARERVSESTRANNRTTDPAWAQSHRAFAAAGDLHSDMHAVLHDFFRSCSS